MRFELFIAARYLRAKRRQAVIGVITAISVLGVAAGVASLIIALAINNGFRQDLQERLLGTTSHVNLMRVENDGIHDWPALQQRLEKLPHVQAAAPAIYEQVLISRGARAGGAVLKGIVPADERRVTALLDSVHEGSAQAAGGCAEQRAREASRGNRRAHPQSPAQRRRIPIHLRCRGRPTASRRCRPSCSAKIWRRPLERPWARWFWSPVRRVS